MIKKVFIFIVLFFLIIVSVQAQDTTGLQKKINEYQEKLQQLKQQKNTLSSQIQYMDTQISLTTLQINETEQKITSTEQEINLLESRIEGLDQSLDYLSKQLIQRIVEGYKKKPLSIISLLLDNKNANDFLNRVKYLKTAQDNNQKLLYRVQETKTNAEEQKKLREVKKIELDKLTATLNYQKQSLDNQKGQKQKLLADTQNDEQVYQNLLAKARAEYSAIQGIIAGSGTESKIREVKKGDTIASVISGASCNSSGEHLHFIVQQNNNVVDPFNFLRSIDSKNCSGSSCDSGDGDSFNPSGNLDWPLSPTITFSQGYGNTWAVRNTWVGRIYSFHNGIDIYGSSNNVTAIADGTLYRGSYAVGCTLSYIKLIHNDSGLITLYLHVYPQ
jgi:peptidoglycan hydrolase CwlO-like protein